MASAGIISQHWEKQTNVFFKNLNELRLNLKSKGIHDLRVAVKKLSAYLILYNLLTGPDEEGLKLADTEVLFNVTGKYRDIEISLTLLKSFLKNSSKYSSLVSFLKNTQQISLEKTAASLRKFKSGELQMIGELIKSRFPANTDTETRNKIKKLIEEKTESILLLVNKSGKQPHELRKELKTLYYWLILFPEKTILPVSQIKKIDGILDQLGLWQDHQVLLTRTKHFRKDFVAKKTAEFTHYKKLEESLNKKSERLFAAANKKFKIFSELVVKKSQEKTAEKENQ